MITDPPLVARLEPAGVSRATRQFVIFPSEQIPFGRYEFMLDVPETTRSEVDVLKRVVVVVGDGAGGDGKRGCQEGSGDGLEEEASAV